MKTLPVAVCILEHDGRIPLIKFKRNYLAGYWGLPGGKLDDDEHVPDAAVRELREELGIETTFERLVATVDEIALDRDGNATRCILFVCRMRAADAEATAVSTEPRDLPEGLIQWFTPEEIAGMESDFVRSDFRLFLEFGKPKWYGTFRSRQEWKDGKLQLTYFDRID